MARTKVFPHKYSKKSEPLFAVFRVDKEGDQVDGEDTKPLVSFGIKKAKWILKHIKELNEFIEENDD